MRFTGVIITTVVCKGEFFLWWWWHILCIMLTEWHFKQTVTFLVVFCVSPLWYLKQNPI